MNTHHPSEKEIQQYALDKSGTPENSNHIESCARCSAEVKTYLFLFSEIKQSPQPSFDFDLSAAIMPLLPQTPPRLSADRFVAGFLVLFITFFVGIPVFLFHHYILNMFSSIPPFFIYSIIACASLFVLAKTLDMHKKYQKQMRLLNFN